LLTERSSHKKKVWFQKGDYLWGEVKAGDRGVGIEPTTGLEIWTFDLRDRTHAGLTREGHGHRTTCRELHPGKGEGEGAAQAVTQKGPWGLSRTTMDSLQGVNRPEYEAG